MRNLTIVTALAAILALPAGAEQSQAYFTQGVEVCFDFGNDGFMVADRLEGLGWHVEYDTYYERDVVYTPGRTVWVIAPPEAAPFPTTCLVASGSVTIMQAEASVTLVAGKSGTPYEVLSHQGCTAFDFGGLREVRIWSDGQDDFCNDPDSARIEVITRTDPLGAQ